VNRRPDRRWLLALCLGATTGCAQITTTTRVEVLPRTEVTPPRLASPHGQVTARGAEFDWVQRGAELQVKVVEIRRCRQLHHEPVLRVEHLDRKANMALYWEYGIAAAFLAVGLVGLIAPQLYSPDVVTGSGAIVKDNSVGYRIGGVFTGIGALALTAGIVDTVRSRDQTYFADAYRVQLGEQVDCAAPTSAIAKTDLEILVGRWSTTATTDTDGVATFTLPDFADEPEVETKVDRLPGAVEPPRPPATQQHGVIRLDDSRTVAFDFYAPYWAPEAAEHKGHRSIEAEDISAPAPSSEDAESEP
jgi:hypothetical protein